MTSKKPSILIVEDEGLIALHLRELLQKSGYDVTDAVPSGEDALTCLEASIPDLVIMDITLNGKLDGIETARKIRKRSDIPIIFLSAHPESKRLMATEDIAPYGFLGKPYVLSEVISAVEKALHR